MAIDAEEPEGASGALLPSFCDAFSDAAVWWWLPLLDGVASDTDVGASDKYAGPPIFAILLFCFLLRDKKKQFFF